MQAISSVVHLYKAESTMLNNEYTKLEIRKLTFKSQEIMHQ